MCMLCMHVGEELRMDDWGIDFVMTVSLPFLAPKKRHIRICVCACVCVCVRGVREYEMSLFTSPSTCNMPHDSCDLYLT